MCSIEEGRAVSQRRKNRSIRVGTSEQELGQSHGQVEGGGREVGAGWKGGELAEVILGFGGEEEGNESTGFFLHVGDSSVGSGARIVGFFLYLFTK
jgi:hypothetical protein